MLGSHFDLAKEVATIAARRKIARQAKHKAENTAAYSDFDRRIRDFVDALTPIKPVSGARHITGKFLNNG